MSSLDAAARAAAGLPPVALLAALRAVDQGEPYAAQRIDALASLPPGTSARLAAAFGEGLRLRLADTPAAPVDRAMRAANCPIARFGQAAANAALLDAARGASAIRIVDLGFAGLSQWEALFAALAARPSGAPRVRLVAIEPPDAPDGREARLAAGERLAARAARRGVRVASEFVRGPFDHAKLSAAEPGERLLLHAARALRRGPAEGGREAGADRAALLAELAAARPHTLVLAELEADHDVPEFLDRALSAWNHYHLVYRALERALDRAAVAALESAVYAREIHAAVGDVDAARGERVAPHYRWALDLARAGFRPRLTARLPRLELVDGIVAEREGEVTRLRVDGATLMNVSAWSPRR